MNLAAFVAADLNLDGKVDLACGNYSSDNVSVLINSGGGAFASAQNTWAGDAPWLHVQDINGDTVPDLLTANEYSDSVSVLPGDGYGQFAVPLVSATGDGPVKIIAGRFDSLPGLELAVINYNADTLEILSPDFAELLAVDTPDGDIRTQRGRGNLENASDYDYWTFEGQAGHQLSIGIDMPGHTYYSRLRWRVYRPDGVEIVNYVCPYYGYGQTPPVTLPMSGRYLLRIERITITLKNTASVWLSLRRLARLSPKTIIPLQMPIRRTMCCRPQPFCTDIRLYSWQRYLRRLLPSG